MFFSFVFILFVVFFSFVLVFIFYLLNFFLSFKVFFMSKNSSFESGFESIGKVHSSFSIHFFIIMLMFVIFDLEVVMLLGFLMNGSFQSLNFLLIIFFIFGGFYMEWYFGKLIWMV